MARAMDMFCGQSVTGILKEVVWALCRFRKLLGGVVLNAREKGPSEHVRHIMSFFPRGLPLQHLLGGMTYKRKRALLARRGCEAGCVVDI